MKNKQINKFLLMFFLSFTLFFSVSYAEFSNLPISTKLTYDSCSNVNNYISDYSIRDIYNIAYNYANNLDNEDYKNTYFSIVKSLREANKHIVTYKKNTGEINIILYSDSYSFGVVTEGYSKNVRSAITKISEDMSDSAIFFVTPSDYYRYTSGTIITNNYGYLSFGLYDNCTLIHSSDNIKELYYSSGLCWDGTSYYYEVAEEPAKPSLNYDLANILNILKESTEVQDSIYPYLEEYFIIPNGNVNNEQVFSVYFYYPSVNLSQFEYLYNDVLYYDLDKTSIDGIISKLTYYLGGNTSSNVVKDVQLATLYYNPETGLGDAYFTGNRAFDQLKSFNSETQPIIYTTKNITYYSATWGETDTEWTATADESKNVLAEEIVDSEGNVVSPVLPGSSTVLLGDTPFERFLNAIQTAILGVGDAISESLITFLDYLLQVFGENVVTFAFLILIKGITVLVSSVALIFRFVSFVLTLVAIPASSTLLAVDVASNSSGLIFAGLNWGTHFVNGLNFIKTIQWNGFGLWTLFEVFVSSLEVVLLVKIVRKHYKTL